MIDVEKNFRRDLIFKAVAQTVWDLFADKNLQLEQALETNLVSQEELVIMWTVELNKLV